MHQIVFRDSVSRAHHRLLSRKCARHRCCPSGVQIELLQKMILVSGRLIDDDHRIVRSCFALANNPHYRHIEWMCQQFRRSLPFCLSMISSMNEQMAEPTETCQSAIPIRCCCLMEDGHISSAIVE